MNTGALGGHLSTWTRTRCNLIMLNVPIRAENQTLHVHRATYSRFWYSPGTKSYLPGDQKPCKPRQTQNPLPDQDTVVANWNLIFISLRLYLATIKSPLHLSSSQAASWNGRLATNMTTKRKGRTKLSCIARPFCWPRTINVAEYHDAGLCNRYPRICKQGMQLPNFQNFDSFDNAVKPSQWYCPSKRVSVNRKV